MKKEGETSGFEKDKTPIIRRRRNDSFDTYFFARFQPTNADTVIKQDCETARRGEWRGKVFLVTETKRKYKITIDGKTRSFRNALFASNSLESYIISNTPDYRDLSYDEALEEDLERLARMRERSRQIRESKTIRDLNEKDAIRRAADVEKELSRMRNERDYKARLIAFNKGS